MIMKMKGEQMKFELGKTYEHNSGIKMKIVGYALTYIHGECYVGEELASGELLPVGRDEESAINWHEVKERGIYETI